MIIRAIKSFEDYIEYTTDQLPPGTFFRGHDDAAYKLMCGLGRYWSEFQKRSLTVAYFEEIERASLHMFVRSLVALGHLEPPNRFDLMAIAQHHGLPTRYLDWTSSAIVALYFAVRNRPDKDAEVYAFDGSLIALNDQDLVRMDPQRIAADYIVVPRGVSNRIVPQSGIFTIQKDPLSCFDHLSLVKMTIPKDIKRGLLEKLCKLGVFDKMLFPDLDGAARETAFIKFGKL